MNHYSTIYLDTVIGLSEKIGVSDTSIINFCTDLGFYGYSEFKQKLKEEFTENKALKESGTAEATELTSLLESFAGSISGNLRNTVADPENRTAFSAAVELLPPAKKIYFVGFYNKAALAKSEAL